MTPRQQYTADLARVTPDMMIAWLERNGWESCGKSADGNVAYYDDPSGGTGVGVPLVPEFADYGRRLQEVIDMVCGGQFPRDVLDEVLGQATRAEMAELLRAQAGAVRGFPAEYL